MSHMRSFYLAAGLVCMATALHAHPIIKRDARASLQQVTPEQIQQAIVDYVRSHKEDTIADVQVRLLEPEQPLSLPSGALGIRVLPISAEGYGRRHFDVVLSINGKIIQTTKAAADIITLIEVAVATKLIKIDDIIQADDVIMARTSLTATSGQYATNLDEVIGKRVVRPLAPRVPITISILAQPYLVHKGDRVTIEAKRKGLLIQTVGITKTVGQVGQMVTVTNQDSGKDLRAKVVAPGLVSVEF